MRTILAVADPICLEAVEKYAAELARAGLPVRTDKVSLDDGWAEETAVRIEWGADKARGEDWEIEAEEPEDGEEAARLTRERCVGDGQRRLAAHYLRTAQFLARHVEAARTWIGGARSVLHEETTAAQRTDARVGGGAAPGKSKRRIAMGRSPGPRWAGERSAASPPEKEVAI